MDSTILDILSTEYKKITGFNFKKILETSLGSGIAGITAMKRNRCSLEIFRN